MDLKCIGFGFCSSVYGVGSKWVSAEIVRDHYNNDKVMWWRSVKYK